MLRRALITLLIAASLGSIQCQKYTTGMQQSLARADEAVAITTLRSITVAQRAYSLTNDGNYGTFEQLVQGGYLDTRFNSGKPKIKDYVFTMNVNPKAAGAVEGFYSCNADPESAGDRAGRHYYIDSGSPSIHVNATQAASAGDEILQAGT
jgi:hypothetical protein